MKRTFLAFCMTFAAMVATASTTQPIQGTIIRPTNKNIQYIGRICFDQPERPRFTFPGVQINACFTGTSLKMIAKPKSGYFMAQIDQAEPFKVAFMGARDSVVTLATALPQGQHTVRLMYIIEGYDLKPGQWCPSASSPCPTRQNHRIHRQQHHLRLWQREHGAFRPFRVRNRESLLFLCTNDGSQPWCPGSCCGPIRHRRLSTLWWSQDGHA